MAIVFEHPSPRGWPRTVLIDVSLADRFICGLNDHLLMYPCQIQGCGHRFCEPCIDYILRDEEEVECPRCQVDYPEDIQKITRKTFSPDYACRRSMSRLQVRCQHLQEGCSFQGIFKQLEEHSKLCGFERILCECGQKLQRKELTTHRDQDCPHVRNTKKCKYGCPDEEIVDGTYPTEHEQKHVVAHVRRLYDDLRSFWSTTTEDIRRLATQLERIEATTNQTAITTTASSPRGMPQQNGAVTPMNPAFVAEACKNMKVMEEKTKVTHNLFRVLFKEVQQVAGRLLSMERRMQQEMERCDEQMRVLEAAATSIHTCYIGTLLWRLGDVTRKTEEAKSAGHASILSPAFYTSKPGYKLCGRIYLDGDGVGPGQYLSLFIVVMKGKYDALLAWPFQQFVTFTLFDQSGRGQHIQDSFQADPTSSSFRRPTSEMNIASGCPRFMSLQELRGNHGRYMVDDTMLIELKVDTQGLDNFSGQVV